MLIVRRYDRAAVVDQLMWMIRDEAGWDYADETLTGKHKKALDASIAFVANQDDTLCGYSRSLDDCGCYIYVCDLLVEPAFRGNSDGRKLMECICNDFPNHVVYVMSDVDGYYQKVGFKRVGSIFEVPPLA